MHEKSIERQSFVTGQKRPFVRLSASEFVQSKAQRDFHFAAELGIRDQQQSGSPISVQADSVRELRQRAHSGNKSLSNANNDARHHQQKGAETVFLRLFGWSNS